MTLRIFTARHCIGCETARELAGAMASRFPALGVDLIDLDEPGAKAPRHVFAVPTYLVGDRVLFLGNPTERELTDSLRAILASGEPDEEPAEMEG